MTGKQLRELRESWNLSQAELGKVLGYTEHQIANLERGRANMTEHFEKQLLNEARIRAIRNILNSD